MRQAVLCPNDDLVDLQNSLRTFRLSNDGLSLLLERTQTQLEDSNAKVTETERRLQSAEMALQVQTQENLALVQLQEVLNQNLQVVKEERDDAIIQKDVASRGLVETGERLQAQIEQYAGLERELECVTSREQDLTLEIKEASIENNSLRQKIMQLEHQHTLNLEAAKSELEATAKLVLDAHIKESTAIIKQWEVAVNAEQEGCRVLEQDIEERISLALETQFNELTVQLNDIVQTEQQRLSKVHEAAMVKQQEIHQQALKIQKQQVKRAQEKTAQAGTAAQLKIRELETRLETLQLKLGQVDCDAQNKAAVAKSTLVDVKAQLQASEANLVMLHESRNLVEKELQSKVDILTAKTTTFESRLKDSESQLAIQRQQVEELKARLSASESAASQAEESLESLRTQHQTTVNEFNDERTILTQDKEAVEAKLVKANSEIKQIQESVSTGQNEITRLTAALNQSEKSIALKNEEFARLNAAYNQSIKVLDDEKREGNTLLILVIAELERKLAIENQNDKESLSLTSRIVHVESANRDLNKYLTELKQKYQVNLEKLQLENTDYESNIHDLDLKLRQAIVAREEIEGTNRVLSEEKNIHRAEKDKLTKMLAAKDAQIKQLTLQEKLLIPRKPVRKLVFDSDTDEDEDTTLVNEPPDKRVDDVENPSDFQLGW